MLLLATLCASGLFPLQGVAAEEQKIERSSQEFGVKLSATRVIYAPDSVGQTLSISSPQDYPMLVQSRVFAEDMKSKAPFVVTPPLFRLDGQQQTNLRIVRTGGDFAKDRESLQWLCVKGIPPKADDLWAKDKEGKSTVNKTISLNLQVSVDNCIKLFVRPESIKGHPDDVASSLSWFRQGTRLKAVNDTPFYMNLSSLKVGGVDIPDVHYISPFSSYTFSLPKSVSGKVSWTIVTDYGGVSNVYQADVK
ncbi:fimbria/pilus periplasmic chaperone [Citrobacter portucalensis]|uniref:fimbria/pilus periplasmic chaperone n=1 Tax=Citrobacter portucalensis TaxID=1639133 RepID=UPI001ECA02C2|nr:fimbria/pilus periplasmic chaperone [Salmonella enterica]